VSARYHRHPDLRLTAVEGEGVVLHLGTRRYFTVNPTGLAILEALVEPRSEDDLVSILAARFDVTAEDARPGARAFLARCLASRLVRSEPAP